MSKSKLLFDDSEGDSDEGNKDDITINKEYANKYSKWRETEEFQRLKDKYGNNPSESDTDTSDDEFVDPDNAEFDKDFLRTLATIHSKDKSILQDENKKVFFKEHYIIDRPKKDIEKPLTIRSLKQQMLEHGVVESEDENSDLNNEKQDYLIRDNSTNKTGKKTIGFEDDNVDLSNEDVFVKTESTSKKTKKKKDKDDVFNFVKGSVTSLKKKDDEKLLSNLRDAWKEEKLSYKEKWLKDFFLNKRYLKQDEADDDEENTDEEEVRVKKPPDSFIIDEESISEDEKTLEKLDQFEVKYRFRFEQPDEDFIKKYPRVLEDNLRLKDDKRKQARETKKRRLEEEKEKRRQEIMQLKAFQKKELQSKIERIQEIAGNEIEIEENELDDEFDASKHDALMSKIFNDEYYGEDQYEKEKPSFEEDEDIYADYDDWLRKSNACDPQEGPSTSYGNQHYDEEVEHIYDIEHPDFNMDADYDPREDAIRKEMQQATKKRSRRRQNKLAEVLEKKKPVYDPQMGSFDQYYEKYYQLDYEDVVAGKPIRFKYRDVHPNSFGLTTEEILSARDRELQRWYAIKRILVFERSQNQEKKEALNYDHRASIAKVKQKILPSLFADNQEEILEADQEKKKEKLHKKKLRKRRRLEREGKLPADDDQHVRSRKRKKDGEANQDDNSKPDDADADPGDNSERPKKKRKKDKSSPVEESSTKRETIVEQKEEENHMKKKKKKKVDESFESKNKHKLNNKTAKVYAKSNKEERVKEVFSGISNARLVAYGANPIKLKNKVKYAEES